MFNDDGLGAAMALASAEDAGKKAQDQARGLEKRIDALMDPIAKIGEIDRRLSALETKIAELCSNLNNQPVRPI